MKKIILLMLLISASMNAQIIIEPDTSTVNLSKSEYKKLVNYNDSISKVRIKPDKLSIYRITKIKREKRFFIIQAERKINETMYYYRIKSDKLKIKNCNYKIEVGKSYQLDVRDYDNHNQRKHFIPGVALNLVTHGSSEDFYNSPFDIVAVRDDQVTQNEYNVALNLKGLCVKEKSECSSKN